MISYPLAVNGVMTRVLEAGHGNRHVVFVHGTGGRADRWSRNLDAVAAAGFHAWAFDLPGHGFASKGAGVACSVPAYRQFLAGFMDAIDAGQAVIVGTSLGGHVVASYACENPQRVLGVALCGSMGLVPIGDEARGRIQAGANNQTREGVATKMQRVIHDAALVTPAMLDEEFRVNNSAGAKESFAALGNYIAADLDKEVVGEALARAAFPVLLVWGQEDKTVTPAVGETVRQLVPRSRLALLAGAAHTAYFERAEHFNAALIGFMEGRVGEYQAEGIRWK
ncbi:MAG: alpha/beta fold hydrolase [Burkholderiales bacterium]|nr:alpha/beta fold hydrolase [Burkholderiales bacterium]